jgi:bifunctional non-homologous end joining protein LigD
MSQEKTYADKRSFDRTPEPAPAVPGNVDPGRARPGPSFLIHQHHARRLHFDLRLEMMNGDTPVLVSWAVPKNLPLKKGKPHLAVHVEDHPFEYGSFSGTIPAGEYGAGEVRIFDSGTYELLEQEAGKVSFRLLGRRMRGIWHLAQTRREEGKDEWLAFLKRDERPPRDDPPPASPMLASTALTPFDDDAWLFEPKWDGVRALATCTDQTWLLSRNTRDITGTYPELSRLHERVVALDAVLDGEVVAMEGGRPSFERLQARINLQNAKDVERAVKAIPVTFIAFDLLYLDGLSLIERPIEHRKELLGELIVPSDFVQTSPQVVGSGIALAQASSARNLEGIVAKKLGSPYRPGKRTKEWLKIKTVHDGDVVIGGWSRGEGGRSDTFGSLLVGAYSDEGLRFVGAVGTGFDHRSLVELQKKLRELEQPNGPFVEDPRELRSMYGGKSLKDPHWVEPRLVARVEFRELTASGRLRAPSYKGLRNDMDPQEIRFEALRAVVPQPGG